MENYTITLGINSDLYEVSKIYEEASTYFEDKENFPCWFKDIYPIKDTAEKAINNKELYIIKENGSIIGSVILNHVQSVSYKNIDWKNNFSNNEILVIHTLCISPSVFGKGIATKLINFTEELAKNKNCKAIRFDTHTNNSPAIKLYSKLGYEIIGEISLEIDFVTPNQFKCFQKILL